MDETPQLDRLDETMVRMYRGGLLIAAAAVLVSGGSHLVFAIALPHAAEAGDAWVKMVWVVLNLHLYAKRARWGIQGAAWLGVILMLAAMVMASPSGSWWMFHVGLAFVFVPLVGGWWIPAGLLLVAAGVLLGALALAKYRRPLHFDVGDKTRYQV
ncbi:MAG: hypothetical protein JRI25_29920 [Deltaproteobacteria bacterium]|nr:hypothetical protein [Deltaproteobacteria bacterium]